MSEIRKVRFNAKYVAILAEFMAKNDVRYYLNGAFITPHPDNGVVLVATDGHTMVAIHDEEGETNGDHIFSLSKGMIAASKKRFASIGKPEAVELIGDVGYVRQFKQDLSYDPLISSMDSHVEHCQPIDGKYPDLRRVIPSGEPVPSLITLNPAYMARLEKSAASQGTRYSGATFYTYGIDKPLAARLNGMEEVLFIIMPMRCEAELGGAVQAWMKSYIEAGKDKGEKS